MFPFLSSGIGSFQRRDIHILNGITREQWNQALPVLFFLVKKQTNKQTRYQHVAYSFISPVVISINLVGLTIQKGSLNLLQMTSAVGRRVKIKNRSARVSEAVDSIDQQFICNGT